MFLYGITAIRNQTNIENHLFIQIPHGWIHSTNYLQPFNTSYRIFFYNNSLNRPSIHLSSLIPTHKHMNPSIHPPIRIYPLPWLGRITWRKSVQDNVSTWIEQLSQYPIHQRTIRKENRGGLAAFFWQVNCCVYACMQVNEWIRWVIHSFTYSPTHSLS